MKNSIYFSILCILLEHCVQKTCGYGTTRRDTHRPLSGSGTPKYNSNNVYVQHQEQHQQLSNAFQSQQQMSTQYHSQAEPLTSVSGHAGYAANGRVGHNEYQLHTAPSSSNYASPYNQPPPAPYFHEQHQLQHMGTHTNNAKYNSPGVQQQSQNFQGYVDDRAVDRNQYQYQNGVEQFQDQSATAYSPSLYDSESQRLTGGIGQQTYGNYPEMKSRQYKKPPNAPMKYAVIETHGSQHVLPPTSPPAMQKLMRRPQNQTNHKATVIVPTALTSTGIRCVNQGSYVPLDNVKSTAVEVLEIQKNKIICPLDVQGIFPYPFSNRQYIKCFDGHLLIRPCGSGLLFSVSRELCDIKDYEHTFDVAVKLPQYKNPAKDNGYHHTGNGIKSMNVTSLGCPTSVSGHFLYPFDYTRYVNCVNGAMEIKQCSNGLIYCIHRKTCGPKYDTHYYVKGAENSSKTSGNDISLGIFCGPQSNEKYAHPEDWRKFVICRHGKITVKRCPQRNVFDVDSKECTNADKAE